MSDKRTLLPSQLPVFLLCALPPPLSWVPPFSSSLPSRPTYSIPSPDLLPLPTIKFLYTVSVAWHVIFQGVHLSLGLPWCPRHSIIQQGGPCTNTVGKYRGGQRESTRELHPALECISLREELCARSAFPVMGTLMLAVQGFFQMVEYIQDRVEREEPKAPAAARSPLDP